MASSQRFVMMVDPAERAEWGERAARAGITTAELVRRGVSAYHPDEDELRTALELLLPEFHAAVDRIDRTLTHTIAGLDAALDPAREAEMRSRARASISDDEIAAVADLLA